jgi:hypothetical protein
MPTKIALCIVAATTITVAAALADEPQRPVLSPSDLPLYAAFKMFCVNTGAKPEAVKAAVEAAGGRPHTPPGGATDSPFPMTVSSWNVTVNGHNMVVGAGTAYPSRKFENAKLRNGDFDSCTVDSYSNEDESISAIVDWVGVPGDVSTNPPSSKYTPGLKLHFYGFQTIGRNHAPAAGEQQTAATNEGRYWTLVLMQDQRSASLQYTHTHPKSAT